MTRTVADASRDYRNKQREKLRRYEVALREIAARSGEHETVTLALHALDQ